MKRVRTLCFVALASFGSGLSGCSGNLPLPQEIDDPVLLGARVEVNADPSRARPRADEPFSIRVFVGRSRRPNAEPGKQLTALASVCAGGRLPSGTLLCVDEVPLETLGLVTREVSSNELDLDLVIPEQVLAGLEGKSDRVTLFGAVCADGKAERVPGKDVAKDPVTELFRCTHNAKAQRKTPMPFTLDILPDFAEVEDDANRNPEIACDDAKGACADGVPHPGERTLAGALELVWPEPEKGGRREARLWPATVDGQPWQKGCADDPLFSDFTIGTEDHHYLIRWRADPSDRQRFVQEEERRGRIVQVKEREELLVSHALSKRGGSLERYFSVVRPETADAEAEIELELRPPSTGEGSDVIPEEGRVARFFMVVGDGRGGAALATRALCVVPGKTVE